MSLIQILSRLSLYLIVPFISLSFACSEQKKINQVSEDAKGSGAPNSENGQRPDDTSAEEVLEEVLSQEGQVDENIASVAKALSLRESCETNEGYTWSEDKIACLADVVVLDSKESCEATEGRAWSESSSQCFASYESITSQVECESNSENAWNIDSSKCFPRYDLVTSKEECEALEGLRWVAGAKDGLGACLEDIGVVCPPDYAFNGESCIYQLGSSVTSPATSCQAIKSFKADAPDGSYWLKGDSAVSFQTYCDMTSDGGGWTLIARLSNDDEIRMLNSGFWYDRQSLIGVPTVRNENKDAFSEAFWAVNANNLKISRSDNVDDKHLLMTENNFINNESFRRFFNRDLGAFKGAGQSWAQNITRLSVPALFGNNFAQTDGFQKYDCNDSIGQPNALNFLSDWTGDAAVIMIGGGGTNCDRADHGIGSTESDSAIWNVTNDRGCDFGFDGNNCSKAYSLNLFVK